MPRREAERRLTAPAHDPAPSARGRTWPSRASPIWRRRTPRGGAMEGLDAETAAAGCEQA